MSGLRSLIRKLGPSWLTKDLVQGVETDSRVLYTTALILDALKERVRLGIIARFPGGGSTSDSIPYLARDRSIVTGPSETKANKELRIQQAIDKHRVRGNAWALLENIVGYCSPHAVRVRLVTERGTFYTIDRDGSKSIDRGVAWNWDNADVEDNWARFWIIIYPTNDSPQQPWARCNVWGTPGDVWGTEGRTWGSTATPADVQSVRAIVRQWKRAGTRCVKIIACFDDDTFLPTDTAPPNPDGTWRTPATYVAGVKVPSRSARAIYWHGTGPING